jgi:hypothetical protein
LLFEFINGLTDVQSIKRAVESAERADEIVARAATAEAAADAIKKETA